MGDFAFLPVILGTFSAVAVRLRRAHGAERQQLKWFAYAVGVLLFGLAAAAVGELTGYQAVGNVGWVVFLACRSSGCRWRSPWPSCATGSTTSTSSSSRTLVYGSLTCSWGRLPRPRPALRVLLAPVTASRTSRSRVPRSRWPGCSGPVRAAGAAGRGPPLLPPTVRRRTAPSRRSPYGCARRSTSRPLTTDLRRVVDDTMQPTHVSLWLREVSSEAPPTVLARVPAARGPALLIPADASTPSAPITRLFSRCPPRRTLARRRSGLATTPGAQPGRRG